MTTDITPLPDAPARAFATDPRENVLLEASAGTGKTTVLVTRYLNLIAAGVDPRNVLAITFTRKAAAEMRHRILEALRHCTAPESRLREDTRALARRALAADAEHGWGLLCNPSRLRVLTIDALNQSYRVPPNSVSRPLVQRSCTKMPLSAFNSL